MPTSNISLKDIAAAIVDELQLSNSEFLSISEVTVSVTYKVDKQAEDDWLDKWYEEFKQREVVPF